MTATVRVEIGYRYQDGTPFPWTPVGVTDPVESLRLLRAYIARAPEYGNNPDDYEVVTRAVTTTAGEWTPVGTPAPAPTSRGITLDRATLEAWAGRSLTDAEVSRLESALPLSTVPESLATIADNINV